MKTSIKINTNQTKLSQLALINTTDQVLNSMIRCHFISIFVMLIYKNKILMKIYFILCLLALNVLGRDYPLYSQCDAKWGNQKLGNSTITICKGGDIISSVAMALSGLGQNQNPSTLNNWLKTHKGYDSKHQFIWASVNSLGVTYQGQVSNALLKLNLDVGYIAVINVQKGAHWVLATGYEGSTIYVKDSLHTTITSYDISQVVTGHNAIYKVPNSLPQSFTNHYNEVIAISQHTNRKHLTQYST